MTSIQNITRIPKGYKNVTYLMREDTVVYGEFLEDAFAWDIFATFTTQYRMTQTQANWYMHEMHGLMASEGIESKFFFVAERYAIGHSYHIHCLIEIKDKKHIIKDKDLKLVKRLWKKITPGEKNYCTLKRYVKGMGANFYVVKNIHRDDFMHEFIC
jgi:hypothetical protein